MADSIEVNPGEKATRVPVATDIINSKHYPIYEGYDVAVAKGLVPGSSIMSAMGERESMGADPGGEDIWRGNDLTPAPTSTTTVPTPPFAGEQMSVVSEGVADNSAGTGARSVMIHYLDALGDQQDELITLNGTTPVDTIATNMRFINDFHVFSAGSGLVPEGNIKIYSKADSGLVYNMIGLGGNKSLVPHRMVPRGKALLIKGWHAEEAKNKRIAFRLRSTDLHGVLVPDIFLFKDTVYLAGTTSGELSANTMVPAFSIIKVTGWPDQTLAEGSCHWWGELYDV